MDSTINSIAGVSSVLENYKTNEKDEENILNDEYNCIVCCMYRTGK